MCGRYANFLTEQELVDAFAIATIADDARLLPPNFNLGPMQQGIIIRQRPDGREAELAKWGLVPGWAKDPGVGVRAFNARAETIRYSRYPGLQPLGSYPIHIVVKHGRTTLVGVVDNEADKILAGVRAREISGVFEVKNELEVVSD